MSVSESRLFFGLISLAACAVAFSPVVRAADFPTGWEAKAPRDEIRPAFAFDAHAGPGKTPAFVMTTDAGVGQQGWVQKAFPVVGGKWYRLEVRRKTDNVESPRRSAIVRIVWLDAAGKQVPADVPAGREVSGRPVPTAEPEHPPDGPVDARGWTLITGTYAAPPKATRAVVEMHLQWAPSAKAIWTPAAWTEASPAAARKVRLAAVHYMPKGKSPRENRDEFAPLVAEAARQKADLVVLGETVDYVGVGKKPHEVAEPIPGPASDTFGKLAAKHKVHLVVSLYERDGRAVYNAAVLLGPDGKVIGKYRKVCLPHAEVQAGVMPGRDYPVFQTAIGKVGMMVCYDGFFPEVARGLAKNGAEVIAWPVWGCDPLLARARANENRVYVVSSTYSAPERNWMLSAVYDRDGTPVVAAKSWGTVVSHEVDLGSRRIGPWNLGDFGAMVERHRPSPGAGK